MHTDNGDTARFEFPWSSTVFRLKWKLRDFDKILAFPFVLWWSVEVIKLLCECDEVCVVFARCYRLAASPEQMPRCVRIMSLLAFKKMLSSFFLNGFVSLGPQTGWFVLQLVHFFRRSVAIWFVCFWMHWGFLGEMMLGGGWDWPLNQISLLIEREPAACLFHTTTRLDSRVILGPKTSIWKRNVRMPSQVELVDIIFAFFLEMCVWKVGCTLLHTNRILILYARSFLMESLSPCCCSLLCYQFLKDFPHRS